MADDVATDTTEAPAPKRRPTKPQGLGKSGSKLWREISDPAKYELRPDELRILEDACREADLCDKLEEAMKYADMIVTGSQGQDVINPMVPELRQHRMAVKALLGSLKLPDEEAPPAGAENPRSVAGRTAAQARWDTA